MHVAEIYQNNAPSLFGVWPTSRTFGFNPIEVFETREEAERCVREIEKRTSTLES